MFSCKFYKMFMNSIFKEHLPQLFLNQQNPLISWNMNIFLLLHLEKQQQMLVTKKKQSSSYELQKITLLLL